MITKRSAPNTSPPRATARVPTPHHPNPRPYHDYDGKWGAFIVGAGVVLGRVGTLAVALEPVKYGAFSSGRQVASFALLFSHVFYAHLRFLGCASFFMPCDSLRNTLSSCQLRELKPIKIGVNKPHFTLKYATLYTRGRPIEGVSH